ncbi:MAG TPA: hypothetical protein DCG34_13300 [Clostridiales bacterium]|jgi:uncharacterized protein YegL|nr:hypothetical protein [Clostridiales bacterium]
MNRNLTEIVFILDRSGSMSGLESDTIGGYNAMLKRQQEEDGEAIVTTVLFDDEYQLLHDRFNIKWIKPITEKEYYVGGSTALLDAMGKSIQKIINVQKNTSDDQKADKVLFVITTDGMENASREYSYGRIKKMVEHQKEKYGWEFIFLGANIDAVLTAERFGIEHDRSANYHADGEGTRLNFEAVSNVVSDLRASKSISKDWKENIDKDFERRQKNKRKLL